MTLLTQFIVGDGVNLMKPDLSHLAWPIGDPERGSCPRTHPKRLYTIQFDIDFRVDNYPYRKGAWVSDTECYIVQTSLCIKLGLLIRR